MSDKKLTYGYVYNLPDGSIVKVTATGNTQLSWIESELFVVHRQKDNVYIAPISVSFDDRRCYRTKGLSVLGSKFHLLPPKVSEKPEDIGPERTEVYFNHQTVWFEESPVKREDIPSIYCGDAIEAKVGCLDFYDEDSKGFENERVIGVVSRVSWFDRKFFASWFSRFGYLTSTSVAWKDATKVDSFRNLITVAKDLEKDSTNEKD